MKRKIIYLLGVMTLIILSSCEKLDMNVRTTLSAYQVEKDYGRTSSHCAAIYAVLPEGFMNIDGAMMASTCDEAEHTLETSAVQKFNLGSWNPLDNPDDVWARYYRGIRLANDFLVMSDSVNLEILRVDPSASAQLTYQTRLIEIKRWKYEVRYLRAFFYFELVKRYGGVPVITKPISPKENVSAVERKTFEYCVQYISDECDSAATNLPVNYSTVTTNYGRATKGAALALKSRLLLYAASDLYNTPPVGYSNPELITMPTGDRTARWQKAADASLAVMNLSGTAPYSLNTVYKDLFRTYNSNEIIFTRRNGATNNFEAANFPKGFDLSQGNTTPSQNLVDAYEVLVNATTAVPFDWNNPAHALNPYNPANTLGRDPRLGSTVILNNTIFKSRAIECWTGGKDGKGVINATKTGYYLKKYIDEGINLQTGTTSVHSWIFIRYAEILLNYAEALNEAQGPVVAVYTSVNSVRQRAGMPALPAGLNQAQMRDKIRNEDRVEFAFEDHRPWDVRRWMLATTYFNTPLRGVTITQTTPGVFAYVPGNVEDRVFQTNMYFYPVPQSELNIMKGWVQNPGW
jgi:starch-binding outer membrane protein, SusD/RagB family